MAEGVYTIQYVILLALAVGALALEAWALIDALRHPAGSYTAAGKLTKPIWLAILGVATALGVLALPFGGGGFTSPLGILSVLAVVAAAVYLTDVRPAVRGMRGRGGGRNSGPYGPW
jgi:4-amino-4-deoxy-L-arabinose transferase-like glycosyltransferase